MKRLQINKRDWLQFIYFCVVGVSNTLVSLIVYYVTLFLFRKGNILVGKDYYAAQVLMFVLSVLWSFYWNNSYVFKKRTNRKRDIGKALVRAYISYGFTGLILGNALLFLWVERLGLSEWIAPLINLVITVPLNFLINKLWTFQE